MVDIKPKVLLRLVRREEEISESFFGKEAESVMPLLRTTLKLNLQHPLPIDTSKPNTVHTPRKSNPLLEGIFYFYFRCFYVTLPGGFSSLVFLIIDTATTKSGLFWLRQKASQ